MIKEENITAKDLHMQMTNNYDNLDNTSLFHYAECNANNACIFLESVEDNVLFILRYFVGFWLMYHL